jgi:predicted small secreted protein
MKSLVTSLLILASMLLTATQSVSGRPVKDCSQYQEEAVSKETAFREFPKFNIKWRLPVNLRAILQQDGSIFIVDPGTYKYLVCATKNPNSTGRGISGFVISKAPKKPMAGRQVSKSITDVRFIVNSPNYDYYALRISHAKGETDIYAYDVTYNQQSYQEDFNLFLSILDEIEVLQGEVNKYE